MFRSTVTPRSRTLCPFSQKNTQSLEPYVRFFSARAIHSSCYVKMAPECSAIRKFEPFAQKANWRGAQSLEPYVQKVCWALWSAPVWQAALLLGAQHNAPMPEIRTLCWKWQVGVPSVRTLDPKTKLERPEYEPCAYNWAWDAKKSWIGPKYEPCAYWGHGFAPLTRGAG